MKGREFECFFNFLGWQHWSLGIHLDVTHPHLQLHLPGGFARIGWSKDVVGRRSRCFGISMSGESRRMPLDRPALEVNGATATAARELNEQNNLLRSALSRILNNTREVLDLYTRAAFPDPPGRPGEIESPAAVLSQEQCGAATNPRDLGALRPSDRRAVGEDYSTPSPPVRPVGGEPPLDLLVEKLAESILQRVERLVGEQPFPDIGSNVVEREVVKLIQGFWADPATLPVRPVGGLFQQGAFTLHSGDASSWKIDCDALTEADLETLASELWMRLPPFGSVEGVPRGGLRLAEALKGYVKQGPLLVVDDVLTTGVSLERQRNGRDAIGAVLFARGPCPSWVTPLFQMPAVSPVGGEQLLNAVRYVVEKFEADEAAGYRSRDRQFAIEVLRQALDADPATERPVGVEPQWREPCALGIYCRTHGYIHGGEAEELRERLAKLKNPEVDRLLDDIDARDSLAYLEVVAIQSKQADPAALRRAGGESQQIEQGDEDDPRLPSPETPPSSRPREITASGEK